MPALTIGAWTLFAFAVGLIFYGYVADRVIFEAGGRLRTEKLGPVDVLIAGVVATVFTLPVIDAIRSPETSAATLPSAARMIEGVVLSTVILLVIIGGIFAGLAARDIRWRDIFGLDRLGLVVVVGYAVLLLALALPLIDGCSILWRLLLAAASRQDDSSQEMVQFLSATGSLTARLIVAASAVFAAPVLEELIFRGYLYGVLRRYAGVTTGIIVNAALFAAIHMHLPSFGGLFILAVCLTLAYEWTGSIFVPITMHALHNLITVAALFHGSANG